MPSTEKLLQTISGLYFPIYINGLFLQVVQIWMVENVLLSSQTIFPYALFYEYKQNRSILVNVES